jgi:hypothetical protein
MYIHTYIYICISCVDKQYTYICIYIIQGDCHALYTHPHDGELCLPDNKRNKNY